MAIEEELRALLLTATGCPVSWGSHPQGTPLPRVLLTAISGISDRTLDGASGWGNGRVQIDCDGVVFGQAVLTARAVHGALHGYRGGSIWSASEIGRRDTGSEAGGDVIQRRSLDYAVTYRE